jgi:hypothetical protein
MNSREILEQLGLNFFDYKKIERENMEDLVESSKSDDLDSVQRDLDDSEDRYRDAESSVDDVVRDMRIYLDDQPKDCSEREAKVYDEVREFYRTLRNIF